MVKKTTFDAMTAIITADDTVTAEERKAILAFCKNPVPAPIRIDAVQTSERYLRPSEAADALKINVRTVQRWIKDGTLESRKVVGTRRIPWSSIQTLVEGAKSAEAVLPVPTDAREYAKDFQKAG